jgi:hypothetical protein
MQDNPTAAAILDMAIAHLQDNLLPSLDARAKFELRVTLSALALVRRTLALTPASDAAETARLEALLGDTGDLETLNCRLAAAIRDGSLTLYAPGLAEHLRATALEKLAVDQPTYAAYKRALEQ